MAIVTNIKNIFILLLFLTKFSSLNAQQICLNVDSLVVTSLPLNLYTRLSLSDFDIKNFDETHVYSKTILETDVIVDFTELDVFNFANQSTITSIDVRIVVDIFVNGTCIYSISLDRVGYYSINNIFFKRNKFFVEWLNQNIKEINIKN